jgi:NAD(P)-dependent dehydrogenase (short-subunit alcohol dehydrogenase family)
MLLNDKIALVTGSTHNIGLAIVRSFAREGAKVIVHSRHEDDAKKVADEIKGDHCVADVSKRTSRRSIRTHKRTNGTAGSTFLSIVWHNRRRAVCSTPLWRNGIASWRST